MKRNVFALVSITSEESYTHTLLHTHTYAYLIHKTHTHIQKERGRKYIEKLYTHSSTSETSPVHFFRNIKIHLWVISTF